MTFSLFWIKYAGSDDFNHSFMDIPSFDVRFDFVGVQIKTITKKYWWQYSATVVTYSLSKLPLALVNDCC